VRIPTYVQVTKRNNKACNLNEYRNLHHHLLNKQKANFRDEVKSLLAPLPRMEAVWLHYTIYKPRNVRLDTMNVGSIVDKYFSDVLVEEGKIPDDNHEHVVFNSFSFGGLARMDGHAIVQIIELKRKDNPMRILLDQDDIQKALDAYAQTLNLGVEVSGVELSVTDEGDVEAEVTLGESEPKQRKSRGGRPKGSRNKPKAEEPVNAETDSDASGDGTDSGGSDTPSPDSEEATSGTTKGNLSGEEENQSSDSETTSDSPETETAPSKVKGKRSSIFDVD
jgi:hypothetical protein